MNIQGSSTVTRSESGDYIGLTDPTAVNRVIFYHAGQILYHEDALDNNVAIAIANNGFSVCSFAKGATFAVRILKIGKVVSSNDQGNKIGGSEFGRGVSITPSADKVAIGNPKAGIVSIFTISSSGEFSSSAVDIVAPVEMRNFNFGEKVGLSPTGNSIAIAVPLYNEGNGGDDIGCVLLYLYNTALSRWVLVNSYIYGSANNLRLGQGGVAVDDVKGRLDANDSAGDRLSYLVRLNSIVRNTYIFCNVYLPVVFLFESTLSYAMIHLQFLEAGIIMLSSRYANAARAESRPMRLEANYFNFRGMLASRVNLQRDLVTVREDRMVRQRRLRRSQLLHVQLQLQPLHLVDLHSSPIRLPRHQVGPLRRFMMVMHVFIMLNVRLEYVRMDDAKRRSVELIYFQLLFAMP